ncbi:MAG: hypothetical protein AAGD11_15970 [Planctomycetota bacterium]
MATIEKSIRQQLERATAASQSLVHDSVLPPTACMRELTGDTQIVASNTGDNPLVLELLVRAHQVPLAEDFQSRLDEPAYSPLDRLLLRRSEQLIGHVQVSKQIGWFHGQRCPLARLQDFVTLPEFRSSEFDAALLEVAESTAVSEGAVVSFARTDRPEWFEQYGWSRCRGQGHTRANTRSILSHLDAQQSRRRHADDGFEVRTWRHFELDSILQIYQQLSTHMWGARQRSLEMWQWLVGRKAHDQVLIAVDRHSDRPETCDGSSGSADSMSSELRVVGYAIVRDSCIVEMLTLPGHSSVRASLIRQACRDAIDRDHHFVSLHTPAADPMHELLVTAGGSWIADSPASDGQWMLKLLSPDRWVERLYPVLHERAREAGVSRPLEIDFALGGNCHRLTLTRRSSRFEAIDASPAAVQCDWRALQDLLTSNLTFPEAIAQGRLRTPHLSILRALAALFPPKLLWHSPFPQLRL